MVDAYGVEISIGQRVEVFAPVPQLRAMVGDVLIGTVTSVIDDRVRVVEQLDGGSWSGYFEPGFLVVRNGEGSNP